ncbi:hypothetical protein B0T16DRAFT_459096 [Cercophora newfieldiana]|uniref:Protein kinase domain-containing protein n=1 Tax=Cercophora newfieldiana TaxID=92897 RepID=A0AA40CL28_9PEZI|nr:hypothetical protein B0T16DRAFT_459096 [Cercophora newfieldiana]
MARFSFFNRSAESSDLESESQGDSNSLGHECSQCTDTTCHRCRGSTSSEGESIDYPSSEPESDENPSDNGVPSTSGGERIAQILKRDRHNSTSASWSRRGVTHSDDHLYPFVGDLASNPKQVVQLVKRVRDGGLHVRKVRRFDAEHRAAGKDDMAALKIEHRHNQVPGGFIQMSTKIVRCTSLSRDGNAYFMYCNGKTLHRWYTDIFRRGILRPPAAFIVRYVRQVYSTLAVCKFGADDGLPFYHNNLHMNNIYLHWQPGEELPDFHIGDFEWAKTLSSPLDPSLFRSAFRKALYKRPHHDFLYAWEHFRDLMQCLRAEDRDRSWYSLLFVLYRLVRQTVREDISLNDLGAIVVLALHLEQQLLQNDGPFDERSTLAYRRFCETGRAFADRKVERAIHFAPNGLELGGSSAVFSDPPGGYSPVDETGRSTPQLFQHMQTFQHNRVARDVAMSPAESIMVDMARGDFDADEEDEDWKKLTTGWMVSVPLGQQDGSVPPVESRQGTPDSPKPPESPGKKRKREDAVRKEPASEKSVVTVKPPKPRHVKVKVETNPSRRSERIAARSRKPS